jgi:hypothetical protein
MERGLALTMVGGVVALGVWALRPPVAATITA